MTEDSKPSHWGEPKNKLFPHQVGFTCPPHYEHMHLNRLKPA